MFNDDDISNEIYKSMEKQLVSNQLENKYAFNKYARTIDYLNKAASIFDQAGMYQESNEVTQVMRAFANKLQNKISLADDKKKIADAIYKNLWDALNEIKNVYKIAKEDGVVGADGNPDHDFVDILQDANSSDSVNKLKKYSDFKRKIGFSLSDCNVFVNAGYWVLHTIIRDKDRLEQAKNSYYTASYYLDQANKLLEQLKQ
jgi:hypothetical protein